MTLPPALPDALRRLHLWPVSPWRVCVAWHHLPSLDELMLETEDGQTVWRNRPGADAWHVFVDLPAHMPQLRARARDAQGDAWESPLLPLPPAGPVRSAAGPLRPHVGRVQGPLSWGPTRGPWPASQAPSAPAAGADSALPWPASFPHLRP